MHKKIYLVYLLSFLFSLFPFTNVFSANIYVDWNLASDCTSGNYSIANHSCTGSDGNAYNTIQKAYTAMSGGDDIYIRGDHTYSECIVTNPSKSGTSENYSSIQSYPGEWAIVDCNHGRRGVFAPSDPTGHMSGQDVNYFIFQRLGITGGGKPNETYSAGILFCGHHVVIRYCDIFANCDAGYGDDNPGAIAGRRWKYCTIEFNRFYQNKVIQNRFGNNEDHMFDINVIGDFYDNYSSDLVNGWSPRNESEYKNEYRYNYHLDGMQGPYVKSSQILSGRVPYSDTYRDYGDKIHHNIFEGGYFTGVNYYQDFSQIYNNIVCITGKNQTRSPHVLFGVNENWNVDSGIAMSYKPVIYNNTLIFEPDPNYSHSVMPINILGASLVRSQSESTTAVAYVYNNIIDGYDGAPGECYCKRSGINIMRCSSGNGYLATGSYVNKNYFYRPTSLNHKLYMFQNNVNQYGGIGYSNSEFESSGPTIAPKDGYVQAYNVENLLFQGTSGANKYKINPFHSIENTTAGLGGIAGNHPYLGGVTLPSYLGAVNPNDNAWVAGVRAMNASWFKSQANGSTPSWLEGNGGSNNWINITSPADSHYNLQYNNGVTISGTAGSSTVEVTWSCNRCINGSAGNGTATGSTSWSFSLSYPDSADHDYFCGNNDIVTVFANDANGNHLATANITIDTKPCKPQF